MSYEFNEFALLKELEPTIVQGYEAHMHPTPTRSPLPIAPIATLSRLAKTSLDADIRTRGESDLLIYGPALRVSLERHLLNFEQEHGVNARPALAATFLVNLLTEDNLPYYASENDKIAMFSEALSNWLKEWISEEDGHGEVMRDYALLTGIIGGADLISHDVYQEGRVSQLRSGMGIKLKALSQASVYLATQELATYYAHLNLGYLLDKPGKSMMRRISGQEYNHYEFYSLLVAKLLEIDPERTLVAIRDQFRAFEMPGAEGIPNFKDLSKNIAVAGIFDPEIIALIKRRLMKEWKLENMGFNTIEAKQAQEDLLNPASRLNKLSERLIKIIDIEREKAIDEAGQTGLLLPFILGRTVEIKKPLSEEVNPESLEATELLAS